MYLFGGDAQAKMGVIANPNILFAIIDTSREISSHLWIFLTIISSFECTMSNFGKMAVLQIYDFHCCVPYKNGFLC